MAHILKEAMTSSNEVFFPRENDYSSWKVELDTYQKTKKDFQGKAEPPKYVTEKGYKKVETQYNPITQKYTNE